MNLVGRSIGEWQRGLPGPCFSTREVVNLFVCASVLALQLELIRVISSLMVGI